MLLQAFTRFFASAETAGSYVAGQLLPGTADPVQLVDPVTEEPSLRYLDAGAVVAAHACAAAEAAQREWRSYAHAKRGRVLFDVGRAVRGHADALAQLEALNTGKPIRDCQAEVAKVAEMFEYYGGWADKLHGETIPVPSSHLNYTLREPLGVLLAITPWNAPLFTAGWNVAPVLAMGNAVVLKPSELTPLSSLALASIAEAAGLPRGLLCVLAGYGHSTAQAALADERIRKVVFVGSPPTGARIAAAAAQRGIGAVLELGGKSANIVFADANLERACIVAQAAIFSGAGQSCVAGSRLLVQRGVYDRFIEMVAEGASRLRVGDPMSPDTEIGPLQNRKQYDHVQAMIRSGIDQGAVLVQGQRSARQEPGFFVPPTVLKNVDNRMAVAREEIFGPVVSAIPFDDESDAIRIANDSAFALAGAVWTADVARAHRVAAQVRAGTFWINSYKTINVASPFGGSGASGYGRSSGIDALREYTHAKSVWVETAADPAVAFGYAPRG